MNKLNRDTQIKIVAALVEGNSIRAISRMVDVSRNTISKLLLDLGAACERYHDEHVTNLKTKRVQADEIWAFVGKKDKALTPEELNAFGIGSTWTWVAMDADSKLIVSYFTGDRSFDSAYVLMKDAAGRLSNRVQLTTDGHKAYLDAVDKAFYGEIDYAQLIKIYGESANGAETRYSPGECTGIKKRRV